MKTCFLTEMGFAGKIPVSHDNMRTEFAWMYALNSDHYNIYDFKEVKEYDAVFIIFPKGEVTLNSVGATMKNVTDKRNFTLLLLPFMEILKKYNKKVYVIQEGPSWFFNEYEINDQFNFFSLLNDSDGIFVHNNSDIDFYRGLFGETKKIHTIRTLLIEHSIENMEHNPQGKAIIGGNFCRWYGGFQSFVVAKNLDVPIYAQTSHAMRKDEERIDGLTHLPRLSWIDWMEELSTFKYAVHLMPTVAAGTFNLNCAYFGIPCIGNYKVDTQWKCFNSLSVDVDEVHSASEHAKRLLDPVVYSLASEQAQQIYHENFVIDKWKNHMRECIG